MEKLSKDELYKIAIELDIVSLLKFCSSSKTINDKVCKSNNGIWLYRLNRDFPDWKKYQDKVESVKYSLFKKYEPIKND